jgi:hypothetical protein
MSEYTADNAPLGAGPGWTASIPARTWLLGGVMGERWHQDDQRQWLQNYKDATHNVIVRTPTKVLWHPTKFALCAMDRATSRGR